MIFILKWLLHVGYTLPSVLSFRLQFWEEHFQLRSLRKHFKHCDRLEKGPYKKYSKRYGINVRSPLLQLEYFDVCSGAIVADGMHDVLEGVLQYETKLVLWHCVYAKQYFTLSWLNRQIEHRELGFMEYKPPYSYQREYVTITWSFPETKRYVILWS